MMKKNRRNAKKWSETTKEKSEGKKRSKSRKLRLAKGSKPHSQRYGGRNWYSNRKKGKKRKVQNKTKRGFMKKGKLKEKGLK